MLEVGEIHLIFKSVRALSISAWMKQDISLREPLFSSNEMLR